MSRRRPAFTLGPAACWFAGWLLLAVTAADAFELKDEAGRFVAHFPAKPTFDKRAGQSDGGPHVHHSWGVDVESRHFSVTYTEYVNPPAKNYDRNVMSLKAATKGRILRQQRIDQNGIDGREVVLLLPDNRVIRQRLFQVGNRLYQAFYGGPYGSERRPDVKTFMESFELLK